MILAHFGTFDVENYGDLLFPLVLEKRLAGTGAKVIHVSPAGGRPVWSDAVSTEAFAEFCGKSRSIGGVVLGGGHLITDQPSLLDRHATDRQLALLAYPQLWRGATEIARLSGCPIVWNAPGVAVDFAARTARVLRDAVAASDYVSVRDVTSLKRLRAAGVAGRIHLVADTTFDVAALWSAQELDAAYEEAYRRRGQRVASRAIVLHVKARFFGGQIEQVSRAVEGICRRWNAFPILVALGPCHGDGETARQVAARLPVPSLVVDRPHGLCEVAALIARAAAFFGSSLHGMITAFAFQVPALAVVPQVTASGYKLHDLLASLDLSGFACTAWGEAEDRCEQLMRSPAEMWRKLRTRAVDQLDEHWRRVHGILARSQSDGRAARSAAVAGFYAARDQRLYQPFLDEQALRVPELLRDSRRKRETADSRREIELQRLAEQDRQVADLRRQLRSTLSDRARLIGWLGRLESGISALLASRRWRVGNWLGKLSCRLRFKKPAPLATDCLADILAQFHRRFGAADVWHDPGRVPAPPGTSNAKEPAGARASVDVIICVHNATERVRQCLDSVRRHTDGRRKIILVDDGSDEACREMLSAFAREQSDCVLMRHDRSLGYTGSANHGLRTSRAEWRILLNSDTVVTAGWLERLLECGSSHPRIGLVGPLSNAASWQSVPERYGADGDWAVNPLPDGWTAEDMARAIGSASRRAFPRVPLLNGFCLGIRREVIETIGLLDETAFPHGYGEESDYCLRAADAGFELAIADHAYVHHWKSCSFSHRRRRQLSRRANRLLVQRYGRRRLQRCQADMRALAPLHELRQSLTGLLALPRSREPEGSRPWRILFLLPASGGGGGAHSVVQEALGMRKLGVDARVAVPLRYRLLYQTQYEAASRAALFDYYNCDAELFEHAAVFDTVVATIYHSAKLLKSIVEQHPTVTPAYYIQDYEPYFFRTGSDEWREARESYELLPSALLFAKTDWLCDLVRHLHGVTVHKVVPSLDHELFFPRLPLRRRRIPLTVTAMVRPATPRRGASRIMTVLKQIRREFQRLVDIRIFGCSDEDLARNELVRDFEFLNHGVLSRGEVAELLRESDLFVDFSEYQAFGRTGLEAMACGCAVVVPRDGGAGQYARDGHNALVVDTSSEDECYLAVRRLITSAATRRRLSQAAIQTAGEFSIHRAVVSELLVLSRAGRGTQFRDPSPAHLTLPSIHEPVTPHPNQVALPVSRE